MCTTPVFNSPEAKSAVLQYYDMLLAQAHVAYERLEIETRFGNTFMLAAGDKSAPPLVLLHGSSMNSVMWIRDMHVFSRSFRVYAPDMPGEPGRSAERQLPFDAPDYADWLEDVFNGLSIQKASLAGISLGAWLAIKFAAAHPARVSRLALLCPAGVGPQNHAFKDIALSLLTKGEAGVDELLALINGGNPVPESMRNYQKLIASSFQSRKEPIPLFTDEALQALTMPSMLVFGEKDIMLDALAAVGRYQQLVPQAKVMLLPEKGHSLTGMAEELLVFLS